MPGGQDTLGGDEARSRLYGAMSADDPLYDRLTEALEIGVAHFDVDYGFVAEVDRETDAWTVLVGVDRGTGRFPEGREVPLSRTYCRRAIEREEVLAFADADRAGLTDDPAFVEWDISCYHGAVIIVDGEPYGTVCFAADEPRDEPFDEHEKSFSLLIAQMAGYELQQERFEIQLEERDQAMTERRAELTALVGRVFGRTLRRAAAEVDETATPLRERLSGPDAAAARRLTDIGAELAAVGDVAGHLDRSTDAPGGPIDLVDAAGRAARRAETVAPDASVAVETPGQAVRTPAPRAGLAVTTLVETAVDRAGDAPMLTLSVDNGDDRALVRVGGDGLTLSDNEASVLRTGCAPSADRDRALWLVNWLVTSADGTVRVPPSVTTSVVELALPRASE
jgi:hypothetical protein